MSRRPVLAIVAVAAVLVLLANLDLHAQEEASGTNQSELVAAARKAYEFSQGEYQTGRGTLESSYQWSVRMRSAEIAAGVDRTKANADHQQRMQELYERVRELHRHGAHGGSATDLAYAEYYLLEAKGDE